MTRHTDVVIVGAGPSGLSAAMTLKQTTGADVIVLEREGAAGGIPRHSDHTGYGIRDLHRVMTGPAYANHLVDDATRAGVEIRTKTMVTDWHPDEALEYTSPAGRGKLHASAILLATGARERPRSARLLPGSRPAGVFTTGELQNRVHVHQLPVGKHALIIGAELVSWSAVLTLKEAGCATVGMVSEYPHAESYGAFNILGRLAFRTPVHTRSRVTRIIGHKQVESVEVENLDTGIRTEIECDTVVTTGSWIPDHELARQGNLLIDSGSKGPIVDPLGRTSVPGVFAAGNCVHPVDTADVASLGGRHVAKTIAEFLANSMPQPPDEKVRLEVAEPLRWVSPGWFLPSTVPARNVLLTWTDRFIHFPTVRALQDDKVIGTIRLPWPAAPGRMFRIPWRLVSRAQPAQGPVQIRLD